MTNEEFIRWGMSNNVTIRIQLQEGTPTLWAQLGRVAAHIPIDANIEPRIAYLCYCIKEGKEHSERLEASDNPS